MRDDSNTRRVRGFLAQIPLHRHAPLWIVFELFDTQAVGGVHSHSASTGDIADNAIPWQGMAAPGKVDENIIQTLHLNAILTGLVLHRCDRLRFLFTLFNDFWWQQTMHHLQG